MDQCHAWQRKAVQSALDAIKSGCADDYNGDLMIEAISREQRVLNLASKEDPAGIGARFNAINGDIQEIDSQTNKRLDQIPNFVQCDALNMPEEWTDRFMVIVLGEFLEHCVEGAARQAVKEAARCLHQNGIFVISFPLDPRPPERQHAKEHLYVVVPGETGHDITVWHQTIWTDEMLASLFAQAGLVEISREALHYPFLTSWQDEPHGWGLVLMKGDPQ